MAYNFGCETPQIDYRTHHRFTCGVEIEDIGAHVEASGYMLRTRCARLRFTPVESPRPLSDSRPYNMKFIHAYRLYIASIHPRNLCPALR